MPDPLDSPALARLPATTAAHLARLQTPVEVPLAPLCPVEPLALARGRAHELTGPARRTLAALLAGAAQAEGPVLWLHPAWQTGGLCPQGLRGLADPGALVNVACPCADDILWATEEALRAGCVALVVAEFTTAPDLRQLRRLHLAAAEGVARNRGLKGETLGGRPAPLALLLAHERGDHRLTGVESRWALHPLHPATSTETNAAPAPPEWRLDRLHARAAPPAAWRLRLEAQGPALAPVPLPV